MQLSFLGDAPTRPTVVAVGTWDPLTPHHRDMLRDLKARALESGMQPAVIILEPTPSAFIHGLDRWICFEPLESRVDRLKGLDIEFIGLVACNEGDLSAGAQEFLSLLTSMMTVKEIWLGFRQSFGSGPAGSLERILVEAKAREISVKRLSPCGGLLAAGTARRHISLGEVASAVSVAGIAPIWRADLSHRWLTAWPQGLYRAIALDGQHRGSVCRLLIERGDVGRWNRICWPEHAPSRFAFMSGPGDDPDKDYLDS